MNPIDKYLNRYQELAHSKNIEGTEERVLELLRNDSSGLNNYFMAALGMSTLILRLGAVIQLCRKFESLNEEGDLLFSKQLLDNLCETLPSDTNWKNIWVASAVDENWKKPAENEAQSLLSRFVTFRNHFVHQKIQLRENQVDKLIGGIEIFKKMEVLVALFENGRLELRNNQYFWIEDGNETLLHPYLQAYESPDQPYIFQGLYNKEKVHLLNIQLGDKMHQNPNEHINPLFETHKQSLRYGAGQIFTHSERIARYQSAFFGRDTERKLLLDFCQSNVAHNILCVKSPAGMGKGALMADLIGQLKEIRIQTLYHFCGTGLQNSLQAVLYHYILQAKHSSWWNYENADVNQSLQRLPSKYIDVIALFQKLLDNHLKIVRNNTSRNLVIILDALDEAFVASSQLKISDWFTTYNEAEEPIADWRSKLNIRWIFSYRCAEDGTENFYKFPLIKETATIKELQPLEGLKPDIVSKVFKDKFNVSEDFLNALIRKAKV